MCHFVFQGQHSLKVCPAVLVPQLLCSATSFLTSWVRLCFCHNAGSSVIVYCITMKCFFLFSLPCLIILSSCRRFCSLAEGGYVSATGHFIQSVVGPDGIFGNDHRHSDRTLCRECCHVDLCSHSWVIHVRRSRGHGE